MENYGHVEELPFDKRENPETVNGMIPAVTFGDFGGMIPAVTFGDFGGMIPAVTFGDFGGMIPAVTFGEDNSLDPVSSLSKVGDILPAESRDLDTLAPERNNADAWLKQSGIIPSSAAAASDPPAKILPLPASRRAMEPIRAASDPAKEFDPAVYIKEEDNLATLIDEFKRRTCLRIYMLKPYCFDPGRGYYRSLETQELKMMADAMFHDRIMKLKNPTKVYNDIANLLTWQYDLVVEDDSSTKDENVWTFRNVIVNIQTMETWPNDGTYFLRSSLQCDFEPMDQCPGFDSIVSYIANGSAAIEQLLWEIIGYILSPDTKAKKFFVFSGVKNSGKSLVASMLTEMIGEDMAVAVNTSQMNEKYSIGDLAEKRLNICMDLADTVISPTVVGLIKMLTGDDMIRSDIKYKNAIHFKNKAKLLLGTNFNLVLKTLDDAFVDRMIVVPFRHSVPEGQEDRYLLEKLRSEFPGIANKAIRYYRRLKENGLVFTKAIVDNDMLASQSIVINYKKLNEEAVSKLFLYTGSELDRISTEEAYMLYSEYCMARQIRPDTQNNFSRVLHAHSLKKDKARIGDKSINAFFGIKPINN